MGYLGKIGIQHESGRIEEGRRQLAEGPARSFKKSSRGRTFIQQQL